MPSVLSTKRSATTLKSRVSELFSANRQLNVFSHHYETPATLTFSKPVGLDTNACFPACADFFLVDNVAQFKQFLREALDTKGNAMLNSEQGGVILFGVDPAGIVQGFEPIDDAQKDFIKAVVANFLKRFDPPVNEKNFTVSFIPVKDGPADKPKLVVLEILLKTPSIPTLYQSTKGSVFLKTNDGKLEGPLKLSRIQNVIQDRYRRQVLADYDKMQAEKSGSGANKSGSMMTIQQDGNAAQSRPPWIEPKPVSESSTVNEANDKAKPGCFGAMCLGKKNKKNKGGNRPASGAISEA